MELIILGSGTYEPELDRHCSSYLLKAGGQKLVFDFGRGVLDQLMKCSLDYRDIDYIFITHTHADHCSELVPLLHISLHECEKGFHRTKDFSICGPGGIRETLENIFKAFHLDPERPKYRVHIRELKSGEAVRGKGWTLTGYDSEHGIPGLCYRLESGGKVFAYSGDTRDCPGIRKACKDADLAVIEASWPRGIQSEDHMTGEDAGRIAQELGVKKLILTHASPYYLRNFSPARDAGRFYRGNIILAEDLMRIRI